MINKEFKIKYKNNFLKVTELINEFDPCGLINSRAPDDEYHTLTNHILSYCYNNKPRQELKQIILDELQNSFGIIDFDNMTEFNKIKFNNEFELFLDKIDKIILTK